MTDIAIFPGLSSQLTNAILQTMIKAVQTFLMWMVLLALPVQGMAQANMFACHFNGDTPDSVQVMDHSMHAMESHEYEITHDSKSLKNSLHGCCNCAPTCAVVLLPVAQTSFGAVQHDSLHPASIPQIPHSADTRRIDRPPKTLAI